MNKRCCCDVTFSVDGGSEVASGCKAKKLEASRKRSCYGATTPAFNAMTITLDKNTVIAKKFFTCPDEHTELFFGSKLSQTLTFSDFCKNFLQGLQNCNPTLQRNLLQFFKLFLKRNNSNTEFYNHRPTSLDTQEMILLR